MLFVVISGLTASLLLALWLVYELLEQPFRILDTSLHEESVRAVQILARGLEESPANAAIAVDNSVPRSIWMEIHDASSEELLFASLLARSVDLNATGIEPRDVGKKSTAETIAASVFRYFRKPSGERTIYRNRKFDIEHEDRMFRVQAARSMEKLDEEIRELFWGSIASFIFVTLVLIFTGNIVAGKILRPIETIRGLAQNISDKNLAERVPIGKEHDEITELSETLNQMLDRLQLSFARQREFLFDTSHELKTPLTTIRLAVEEMNANDDLPAEEAHANISRLESQVLRMERLVKNLLNLSSLEALHSIEGTPVRIDALLLPLIDEYRFLADAENIRMETDIQEGLVLFGDEEKLRRAFSNVLSNAIKYNEGSMDERLVTIQAFESQGTLRVIVSNTGEPLSEEESRRIFEQFYRVEKSRSQQRGGSGLGLAIVKKTVELHRGDIRFESVTTGSRNMNRMIISFTNTFI